MAPAPPPSSPSIRRSFSLPPSNSKSPSLPDPQVEILYNLPYVRIVAFVTATSNFTRRSSSSYGSPIVEEEPGTLPWVSLSERTIAVGPLRIYRAPGSVAFLSCAKALQPIMPKSQSWCVDGDSKFVLQIRRPQYWRIEVPNESAEEKTRIEELKDILSKVLLFEKTPCPFQRDFVVELPEAPQTPVKKRPWRPLQGPQTETSMIRSPTMEDSALASTTAGSPSMQSLPTSSTSTPTAKTFPNLLRPSLFSPSQFSEPESRAVAEEPDIAHLPDSPITSPESSHPTLATDEPLLKRKEVRRANTLAPSLLNLPEARPIYLSNAELKGVDSDGFSDATDDTIKTPTPYTTLTNQPRVLDPETDDATDDTIKTPTPYTTLTNNPPASDPETECQPPELQSSGSAINPPVLSLITRPPSKHRSNSNLTGSTIAEPDSGVSSSVDSFHSVQSWHSPLGPPSPGSPDRPPASSACIYPHDDIVIEKRDSTRQLEARTVTPETPGAWGSAAIPDDEQPEPLSSSPPPPKTPPLAIDTSEKPNEERIKAVRPLTIGPSLRHRATTSNNSRIRELSPLPPAVNLFSPTRRRPRRVQTARHLPTAIVQKTYEILVSPPSHLLHLMLNIASKIAAGEWRGFLFSGYDEVHWDFEDEYLGEMVTEDDYGVSLTPPQAPPQSRKIRTSDISGSWEID